MNKRYPISSDIGDEPCVCSHPRRSHLGNSGDLCFGCYAEDMKSPRKAFAHNFKLDNLAYIEQLHDRKELEKFKRRVKGK